MKFPGVGNCPVCPSLVAGLGFDMLDVIYSNGNLCSLCRFVVYSHHLHRPTSAPYPQQCWRFAQIRLQSKYKVQLFCSYNIAFIKLQGKASHVGS